VVDELLCTKSALPPPPTVTDIDCPGVVVKLELLTTAPPPPPCGHQTPARPAPPLLPPPTTKTRTDATLLGTVHSQLPTVENVRIVSPLAASVDVGTHAAAFAGTGIETNKLVSRIIETIVAIFDRAALTFMRTKSRITFTSLLSN
jgi:hypothetical protein